ncbi:MAG: cysteine hydrolase family protein [Hyphomicrobiales bacterium]
MTNKIDGSTALLVVDAQQAIHAQDYWEGERNNPQAETNIRRLLDAWRNAGRERIFVVHDSTEPGSLFKLSLPTGKIIEKVAPKEGELVIEKSANSAFIGTDLELQMRRRGVSKLVITGFITDHCVETTTRMAGNLGYGTILVSDATATFDRTGPDGKLYKADLIHNVSLASLNGEFAEVLTIEEVLARM